MRIDPTDSRPGSTPGLLVRTATVPFVTRLAGFGDALAVRTADRAVTYAELADLVAERAAVLGTTRRLVLLGGRNDLESLVTYLAALSAGHPLVLVPGDNPGNLAGVVEAYDPDVVAGPDGALQVRREGTAHDLHPELALLLSTSGSTGSPKLVRLSADNVQANAASIAEYLDIRPSDVAATTLPMHYCYGLSVINSHLLAGAGLMLTGLSVVDTCFWDQFRAAGATTFAAVPYTFDLLDRVGFASMELPSLRYVTQAGGRLAPDRVRRYAELGRGRGWDLFVMYGQTEATARMAYLPPDLALTSPGSIGVPIPGGSFHLEPLPETPLSRPGEPDVGELVYDGPNVMLGYAETPADLALGRVTTSLRTGDVARRTPDGLFEVVGRRTRFAKIFGLRIDLDEVERVYASEDMMVACAAAPGPTGERLVVAISDDAAPVDVERVAAVVKAHLGLPRGAVAVCPVHEVPRLPNGKADYRAVAALGGPITRVPRETAASHGLQPMGSVHFPASPGNPPAGTAHERLREVYAEVLRRDVVGDEDSFVSLEGDSLSYVEMSIRVEEVLGHLPPGWHTTPIGELAPREGRPQRGRSVETNVLLRALAIVAIVGSHANLFVVVGGAHVLLGLSGFNFGRFHLTDAPRADRVRHMAASIARVAVPSAVVIGVLATWTQGLTWKNALLLNGVLGSRTWTEPAWHYWFIEALVYTLLATTLLMALPVVDRAERRWPFWLPVALAGLGLLTRYEVVELMGGDVIHRANVLFWLFALGWATVKATATWQRLLVSAVVVATVPGFFGDPARDAVVVAGLLVLVWVPSVRLPSSVTRLVGVLASASLYVYLVHWQVYPWLENSIPWLATVLSLVVGVALWQVVERVTPSVVRLGRRAARFTRGQEEPAPAPRPPLP
ncbi:MAG TPA: AMP-binding protein [Nocardioidaceae bacterium]|nr:AMP-binding protein [Nocardioidaceae bacterium]